MQFIGVIPARYNSTRFPGKPLVLINGKTMIQRVYEQVLNANVLSNVVVATDDERIEKHVKDFGGKVVLTSPDHKSGTDRCFEAVTILKSEIGIEGSDVIINIQGDEPYIDPVQIKQIVNCFQNKEVRIATLIKKISDVNELFNNNVVKCIISAKQNAIYFSRHPIPFMRNKSQEEWINYYTFFKHIGIYAYYCNVLEKIVKLEQTSLEIAESLEQLRWIQNDIPVYAEFTEFESIAIDTPEDIKKLNLSL
jgi:3-deoxy-manno-octulosonate cytidylyltransferase (CMP-KDO synthetase)